jgi:glycosyltransferase involved in cell wall biosynthesis
MKVYFDNVDFNSRTGPNTFAIRLAQALGYKSVTIADSDDYDIALSFIEPSSALNKDKPYVLRLDGFWFSPKDWSTRNVSMKSAHESAAAVVYQSEFDKKFCQTAFGKPKSEHVILNGSSIGNPIADDSLLRLRKEYDQLWCCSANWHAQKRFEENYRLLKHVREKTGMKIGMIVLGKDPPINMSAKDRDVFYTGSVGHYQCMKIYGACDWMVHMAWLDHCPNTVVEALSVGTPVIVAGSGGTPELVSATDGGIVIPDTEFDFTPNDYENPPPVLGIDSFELPRNKIFPNMDGVDIRIVADKYIEVFEMVLGTKVQ